MKKANTLTAIAAAVFCCIGCSNTNDWIAVNNKIGVIGYADSDPTSLLSQNGLIKSRQVAQSSPGNIAFTDKYTGSKIMCHESNTTFYRVPEGFKTLPSP